MVPRTGYIKSAFSWSLVSASANWAGVWKWCASMSLVQEPQHNRRKWWKRSKIEVNVPWKLVTVVLIFVFVKLYSLKIHKLHKKWSFPLRTSLVNGKLHFLSSDILGSESNLRDLLSNFFYVKQEKWFHVNLTLVPLVYDKTISLPWFCKFR